MTTRPDGQTVCNGGCGQVQPSDSPPDVLIIAAPTADRQVAVLHYCTRRPFRCADGIVTAARLREVPGYEDGREFDLADLPPAEPEPEPEALIAEDGPWTVPGRRLRRVDLHVDDDGNADAIYAVYNASPQVSILTARRGEGTTVVVAEACPGYFGHKYTLWPPADADHPLPAPGLVTALTAVHVDADSGAVTVGRSGGPKPRVALWPEHPDYLDWKHLIAGDRDVALEVWPLRSRARFGDGDEPPVLDGPARAELGPPPKPGPTVIGPSPAAAVVPDAVTTAPAAPGPGGEQRNGAAAAADGVPAAGRRPPIGFKVRLGTGEMATVCPTAPETAAGEVTVMVDGAGEFRTVSVMSLRAVPPGLSAPPGPAAAREAPGGEARDPVPEADI